ncbi:MAG: M48 family metallopeptidase [Acidimicrobiia bacterium]
MAGFVVLIVGVVTAFELAFGYGPIWIVVAFVIAMLMVWGSYYKSDTIALKASRAKPAPREEYARYHNLVEGLCIAGGLPKPRLYIVDDPAPNAFATGRNPQHAAVAVTTGLLEKMNRVELEGVLAHELSHVKNYDILVSTICVTMVGVIALLADMGFRMMWLGGGRRRDNSSGGAGALLLVFALLLLVLAPIIARIMQFSVSRKRELLADASGVQLTRYPPGLISALEKLKDDQTVVHSATKATAQLWIESPLDEEEGHKQAKLNRMFQTHPPLDERIRILQEM